MQRKKVHDGDICYMFALGTCAVNLPVAAIVADIVRELHAMST